MNTFTYSGDQFYTKGKHSLKFGGLLSHVQLFSNSAGGVKGQASFNSIADFLTGLSSTFQYLTTTKPDRTYHYNLMGFYVQDDWRLLPKLTLNVGLRYEPMSEIHEVNGDMLSLHDVLHDAALTRGLLFKNPSLHNFGPRFGFAWDVRGDGKTAVRGGFAETYDLGNVGFGLIAGKDAQPPLINRFQTFTSLPLTMPLTFPPGALSRFTNSLDYNMRQPHMLSYNFTVEQQLPANMAVSLAYVGSRGLNLFVQYNGNPTIPAILSGGQMFWTGTEPRVNPNWAAIGYWAASADSWYNSLQLTVTKRLSKGLEFNSAYTWQKLIDEFAATTSAGYGGGSKASRNALIPRNYDKGPADWNNVQVWHFETIYRFPSHPVFHGFTGGLLNGWWMSGILILQDGLPFTTYLAGPRSRNGEAPGLDRPNVVSGRNNSNITSGTTAGCPGVAPGQKLGTPNLYYDPCAFSIQAIGTLGNEGRNILLGPRLFNLDYSLVKDTASRFLGESGKLQFRAEIFNILNHANFSRPGGIGGNFVYAGTADVQPVLPNAGRIVQTDTPSRQLQFALKLIF